MWQNSRKKEKKKIVQTSNTEKSRTSPVNLIKLPQCCIAENNSEPVSCKGKGLQGKELKTENIHVKEQVYTTSICLIFSLQAISE